MANREATRHSSKAHEGIRVVVDNHKYYLATNAGDLASNIILLGRREKWRILKNIVILSLAIMLVYVAYQGTLNLQSSLNSKDGLGTTALSCIYISMGISCMFLPTVLIRYVTCKWTLVISMISFIPYISLQLHSSFYTLIPAGILAGIAKAPLWASASTYLTHTAQIYAIVTGTPIDSVITLFFGFFYFFVQHSDTIGNAISSIVLSGARPHIPTAFETCGAQFCDDEEAPGLVNFNAVVLLICIYVPCILLSVLLVSIFLDPLSRYGEGHKSRISETVKNSVLATFHQMMRRQQLLLIPLTIYIGMEQGWLAAEFTQAYVACVLGIHMVGFVLIFTGVAASLGCLAFGVMMNYSGRNIILFLGGTIQILVMGFELAWRAAPDHPAVLYTLAALWGLGDAVWVTQINGLYGLLFRRNKESAFSNYRLFEALGFTLSFFYSQAFCIRIKLYILLLMLFVGLAGYLAVEVLYQGHDFNIRKKYDDLAKELIHNRAPPEQIAYVKSRAEQFPNEENKTNTDSE